MDSDTARSLTGSESQGSGKIQNNLHMYIMQCDLGILKRGCSGGFSDAVSLALQPAAAADNTCWEHHSVSVGPSAVLLLLMLRPWLPTACRVSEIRAVNLLEDLCDAMDDYTLVTPSSSSDGSNDTEQQQQQAAWVKYKGDGSMKVNKSQR